MVNIWTLKKPALRAFCAGRGVRYKSPMGGVGTGADRGGVRSAACAFALGLIALAGGCDPGGAGSGPAKEDSLRFAHTLRAGPGPEIASPSGTALPGGDQTLVWARVVSPEATDRLAAHYCADLEPFGPAPWRIPTADELASAPLDRFPFHPGDLLWTVDRPEDAHHRRVVVDPRTRTRESRAPSQALHLRVLCVTDIA
jgi:hypothetical protein